jgi:hypothetical protein
MGSEIADLDPGTYRCTGFKFITTDEGTKRPILVRDKLNRMVCRVAFTLANGEDGPAMSFELPTVKMLLIAAGVPGESITVPQLSDVSGITTYLEDAQALFAASQQVVPVTVVTGNWANEKNQAWCFVEPDVYTLRFKEFTPRDDNDKPYPKVAKRDVNKEGPVEEKNRYFWLNAEIVDGPYSGVVVSDIVSYHVGLEDGIPVLWTTSKGTLTKPAKAIKASMIATAPERYASDAWLHPENVLLEWEEAGLVEAAAGRVFTAFVNAEEDGDVIRQSLISVKPVDGATLVAAPAPAKPAPAPAPPAPTPTPVEPAPDSTHPEAMSLLAAGLSELHEAVTVTYIGGRFVPDPEKGFALIGATIREIMEQNPKLAASKAFTSTDLTDLTVDEAAQFVYGLSGRIPEGSYNLIVTQLEPLLVPAGQGKNAGTGMF